MERRLVPVMGSALRYAVIPLGSVAVSWWVVHRASMDLWSAVVAPLVLVQLATHIAQWGQRDLLLRILSAGHLNGAQMWRDSLLTRLPILLPAMAVPALVTHLSIPWLLVWSLASALGGGFEPLVIRDKRFTAALGADLAGLLVQFAVLVSCDALDATAVIRSFAAHQVVRGLLLWWVCGAPRPWPARFDAHVHIGQAFPFVLIGLGGLLATRIDVYAVTAMGKGELVGRYQVIAALFVQFQVIPGLLTRPFSTGMMRMDKDALVRASARSARWGLLLLIPQMAFATAAMTWLFHIPLSWPVLVAGAFTVLPAYGYVPLYPILYQERREHAVVVLSFFCAGVIAAGAWLLVPRWGVAGGLASSALGQWVQWIGMRMLVR